MKAGLERQKFVYTNPEEASRGYDGSSEREEALAIVTGLVRNADRLELRD